MEKDSAQTLEFIQPKMKEILEALHEDPTREGLLDTPKRFAKSMQFLTSGYHTSVEGVVGKGLFAAESSEMIIVKDIELYSLCEHHMLPFFGKAHVAYIPNKKIIGLSKIPRIVDVYARRLQVQERLTAQKPFTQKNPRQTRPHRRQNLHLGSGRPKMHPSLQ